MSLRPSEHSSIAESSARSVKTISMKFAASGSCALAADVAVDLVAARVLHRLGLGELAGVLALADRRMIVRELGDPLRRQLVEAAVADVANRQLPPFEHRQRQHARHALAAGVGLGAVQDLAGWRA